MAKAEIFARTLIKSSKESLFDNSSTDLERVLLSGNRIHLLYPLNAFKEQTNRIYAANSPNTGNVFLSFLNSEGSSYGS